MQLDRRINATSAQCCVSNIRVALKYFTAQLIHYTDLSEDEKIEALLNVLDEFDESALYDLIYSATDPDND